MTIAQLSFSSSWAKKGNEICIDICFFQEIHCTVFTTPQNMKNVQFSNKIMQRIFPIRKFRSKDPAIGVSKVIREMISKTHQLILVDLW